MSHPSYHLNASDYQRMARAVDYIVATFRSQPSLEEMAGHVALSPFHFNRLFRRWAGVTPKRLVQQLTLDSAKRELAGDGSVLQAALEAGLSGPGRLHDLFITLEAVTPGEFKGRGAGLEISYGFARTPFGRALLATTPRGLCSLWFSDGDDDRELQRLAAEWPRARLHRDDRRAEGLARIIWPPPQSASAGELVLHVRGTNFQVRVWRALLESTGRGCTTYAAIAAAIGQPGAARAVGQAVGANPVAWLIPCHHVLRSSGALGGYRWGDERKQAMLAWEYARDLVTAG